MLAGTPFSQGSRRGALAGLNNKPAIQQLGCGMIKMRRIGYISLSENWFLKLKISIIGIICKHSLDLIVT